MGYTDRLDQRRQDFAKPIDSAAVAALLNMYAEYGTWLVLHVVKYTKA